MINFDDEKPYPDFPPRDDIGKVLAFNLRLLRCSVNLAPSEVAQLTGIDEQDWLALEDDAAAMTIAQFYQAVIALGMPYLAFFIGMTPPDCDGFLDECYGRLAFITCPEKQRQIKFMITVMMQSQDQTQGIQDEGHL